ETVHPGFEARFFQPSIDLINLRLILLSIAEKDEWFVHLGVPNRLGDVTDLSLTPTGEGEGRMAPEANAYGCSTELSYPVGLVKSQPPATSSFFRSAFSWTGGRLDPIPRCSLAFSFQPSYRHDSPGQDGNPLVPHPLPSGRL